MARWDYIKNRTEEDIPEELRPAVTRAKKIMAASPEFQRAYYSRYMPDSLLRDLGAAGVRREDLRHPDLRRTA